MNPHEGSEPARGEINPSIMFEETIDDIINAPERKQYRIQLKIKRCKDVVNDTLSTFLLNMTETNERQPNLPEHLMNTIFRECLNKEDQQHP